MSQDSSKVQRLLSLIAEIHLDTIDPASLEELDAMLHENESMRRLYLELTQIATLMGSAGSYQQLPDDLDFDTQSDDDRAVLAALFDEAIRNRQTEEIREHAERALAANMAQHVAHRRVLREQPAPAPRVIVIPRMVVYGLAAATLLIATGLIAIWSDAQPIDAPIATVIEEPAPPAPEVREPVILAHVMTRYNDRWSQDSPPVGGPFIAGEYELLEGFVQFRMSDGAEVLLQGPARFQLNGSNTMALHKGKLVASVPPSAIGFTVDTPSARIVDIGTEFGVSAGIDNADTHLQVYRGEVRAAPKLQGEVSGEFVSLYEEEAVEFIDEAEPSRIAFDADRYARDLLEELIRPSLSRDAQWVTDAPANLQRGASESDKLQVILERQGQLLDHDVVVDFNQYQGWPAAGFGKNLIAAGQRVDVYLLHLDSPGERRIDGDYTIQFNRPILGAIGTSIGLNKTDASLGHPEIQYLPSQEAGQYVHEARGLDIDHDDDLAWVEADGTTLRLKIASSFYVDQIRVIVQAVPEIPETKPIAHD